MTFDLFQRMSSDASQTDLCSHLGVCSLVYKRSPFTLIFHLSTQDSHQLSSAPIGIPRVFVIRVTEADLLRHFVHRLVVTVATQG